MTFDEAYAVQRYTPHPKPWMYVGKLWFIYATEGTDFISYVLREDQRLRLTRSSNPLGIIWTASWEISEGRWIDSKDATAKIAIENIKELLVASTNRLNELFDNAIIDAELKNKNNV